MDKSLGARALTCALTLALGTLVAFARCGGGHPVFPDPDAGSGSISGLVVKGRVAGATVTAYGLDTVGGRKSPLGTATTDTSGAFRLELPSYNGPLLFVATGGSFAEEAVAEATVRLDQELTYLLGNYQSSRAVDGVSVTPVSHLAAGAALHWVAAEGKSVAEASDEAWLHINNHFGALLGGGLDWRRVTPADFTTSGTGQLDGSGRAGLVLAGLSMEARTIAEKAGLTPGAGVTSLALVEVLYQDIHADGFFDGVGTSGQLVLPAGGFVTDAGPTASPLDGNAIRLELARAIEQFIKSDRNATPASVNDVLPLLDQLSTNTDARIFRTGGVGYDHTGPALTLTVKWQRADGVLRDPVGPGALVGGTVQVAITATDDSTIRGLTLTANGSPVALTQTGSGGSIGGSAHISTSSDGPLTLVVSSADVHGNPSSTTRQLLVNNTPPSIIVAAHSPSATAFYASVVPVNLTASDTSGLATFTQSGLTGFVNQSGVSTQISGTWTVPLGLPDGPVVVTLTAVNVVGNVTTDALPFRIDRTPPTVSLRAPAPPQYTAAGSLTVHVDALDTGAGVGAVVASVNGGPDILGNPAAGGGWDVDVPLGPEGNKTIRVWSLDQALPTPNSSFNSAAQVQLTRDGTNPAPVVVSVPSYFDERPGVRGNNPTLGMELEVDASGNPLVPTVVKFPVGSSRVAVVGASNIYKASTRLTWGPTAPTVTQLYNQDGLTRNIPFIVFDVPVSGTEAPIMPVTTYTITCVSGCSGAIESNGQLLRDTSFISNPQRFILPLTIETIPQLGSVGGALAQIRATVSVSDEAGNVGSARVDLSFHVIAPPVVWSEDSAYPAAADPKSIFAYHRSATANYEHSFNSANAQFIGGRVRLLRYVVQNASSVPIAIAAQPGPSTYQQIERWDDVTDDIGTTNALRYSRCYSTWIGPSFCVASPPGFKYQDYFPAADCSNIPGTLPSTSSILGLEGPVASSTLAPVGFLNPQPGGNEATSSAQVGSAFVVPAAGGTNPGKLVVYLTRPAVVPRSVALTKQDVMTGGPASLGPNAYSFSIEDFWSFNFRENCLTPDGFTVVNGTDVYTAKRHGRYLGLARTAYSGVVTLTTQPLDSGNVVTGETSTVALGYTASVAFTH